MTISQCYYCTAPGGDCNTKREKTFVSDLLLIDSNTLSLCPCNY
jgi:hypothetical protein